MLSRISIFSNNLIKYSFTSLTPTQIIYEFKIREILNLLRIENLNSNFRANDISIVINNRVNNVSVVTNNKANNVSIVINNRTNNISIVNNNRVILVNVVTILAYSIIRNIDEDNVFILSSLAEYRLYYVNVKNIITFSALRIKK